MERSATGGGSGLLDRPHRFGEPDHGWRTGCGRCWLGRAGLPPGPPGDAAASQLRLKGGGGRWRTGGRDRQHVRGARVRRHVPRAAAHRRNDRRRDGRSPHQPHLSGAAAADPRRDHRGAGRRRGRLGAAAVAARAGDGGRPCADHRAVHRHPALHARPRGGAGRSDPARRAAGGGDRVVADRARTARSSERAAAAGGSGRGDVRAGALRLSQLARRFCGSST